MDYFDDDWCQNEERGGGPAEAKPVQAEPIAPQPVVQQKPVGPSTTRAKEPQYAPQQTNTRPQQTNTRPQQTNTYVSDVVQRFDDSWDTDPMFDPQYRADPAQEPPTQSFITETKQEQKDVEEEVRKVVEPEPEVVVAEEPPKPAPAKAPIAKPIAPAQAVTKPMSNQAVTKPNLAAIAKPMSNQAMTKPMSNTIDWKKSTHQHLSSRKNPRRKGPITTQQQSVPAKRSIQNEASAVSADDNIVQQLLEKVRALEDKVTALEMARSLDSPVVTLNSDGKITQEGVVVWNSNHIIKPRKGLRLNQECTEITVLERGLYQINFTTCGPNPTLQVNNDVYAAAISPSAGTSSINIYLFLGNDAKIVGRVQLTGQQRISDDEDPCKHWLCARLVHGSF